jgi:tRNA U54 and U55 pseudouridine synthase Pus10
VSRQIPKFDVIDDQMAAVLREKTELERLQIGFEMWHSAQKMIRAIVAAEHPEWSSEEVHREVAKRMSHGDSESIQEMLDRRHRDPA